MNEQAVIESLDSLITDNMVTLLTGLTKGGSARLPAQVTTSPLAPAVQYYYIAIDITEATAQTIPDGNMPRGNVAMPLRETRYTCTVGVTDQAVIQQNEEQPYEKLHRDFRRFTDRLLDLVEQQRWIIGPSAQKYELLRTGATSDRAVRKRNMSGDYLDQEANIMYSVFYTQLDFILIEKCPDRTLLYN